MYDILDKIQRIQTFLSSENITFFSIINSHTSQKAGSTDGARDWQKSRIQLQGKLGRIHGETRAVGLKALGLQTQFREVCRSSVITFECWDLVEERGTGHCVFGGFVCCWIQRFTRIVLYVIRPR